MNEDKTNDEIFAEALFRILENQIEIKVHFGLAKDKSRYYSDCERDYDLMDELYRIAN